MKPVNCNSPQSDYGPNPYITNIGNVSAQNQYFRSALWTGCHLQLTLMCIPPCGEVGLEVHPDTDQLLRVEWGEAAVTLGACKGSQTLYENLRPGDAVFVPAGVWHNIRNTGRCPLKLSSVYAPPHHPHGTVHRTKKEAEE